MVADQFAGVALDAVTEVQLRLQADRVAVGGKRPVDDDVRVDLASPLLGCLCSGGLRGAPDLGKLRRPADLDPHAASRRPELLGEQVGHGGGHVGRQLRGPCSAILPTVLLAL
jgi:hypothetical protein